MSHIVTRKKQWCRLAPVELEHCHNMENIFTILLKHRLPLSGRRYAQAIESFSFASKIAVALALGGINQASAATTPILRQDYPSGSIHSYNLMAQGPYIWVAHPSSLAKLRASDGQILATYPVDFGAHGMAFDGTHIWVVAIGSNTNDTPGHVRKLRASDGTTVGKYTVGALPRGVAYDGIHIWVTNSFSNNVTRLRASDGLITGTFAFGNAPVGIVFDGTSIWVGCYGSNAVYKIRPHDGFVLGIFPAEAPYALAFDGSSIWAAGNATVKLRSSDGAVLGWYYFDGNMAGVTFDGEDIWISHTGRDLLIRLRASTGLKLGEYATGGTPIGLTFDGTSVWSSNWASGTVTKLTRANPPHANAGKNQIIEAWKPSGADVVLDGSASIDPNGLTLTYIWRDKQGSIIASTAKPTVTLPLGDHVLTLTVVNELGQSSSASTQVLIRDTTPPVLEIDILPSSIWPANNKLTSVSAAIRSGDAVGLNVVVTLLSITANDPLELDDIRDAEIGSDDRSYSLRAVKSREYTVAYQAMDESGNKVRTAASVTVSHEKRGK